MTSTKNYFQTKAITSLPSPYLGLTITILLYNKYGHPYLTYLPQKCLSKLFFFLKKVWLRNTLPTYDLDICPKFHIFFLPSPYLKNNITFFGLLLSVLMYVALTLTDIIVRNSSKSILPFPSSSTWKQQWKIRQSVSQSISQSVSLLVGQSVSQSVSQSVRQ